MKTKHLFCFLPLLLGACKKTSSPSPVPVLPAADTAKPPPSRADTCTQIAWSMHSAKTFQKPCGMALSSKTGELAISVYNGGYGLSGNVAVYASVSALLTGATATYTYTQAKAPEALVFDAEGNLFVAETEATAGVTILKRGAAGGYTYLKTIQGGFYNPRGMAFDNEGQLYLCDDGNNRILRFKSPLSSNASTPVIAQLGSPKGIACNGNLLFVAEYSGNRVSQWAIGSFGAPAATVAVASPVDIAVNDCFVAVGCPAQGMVKVFHRNAIAIAAGNVAVGGQLFGMVLPAGKTELLLSAYDAGKAVLYRP